MALRPPGESLHAAPQTRFLDSSGTGCTQNVRQAPLRNDVLSVFAGIRPQVRAAGNASTELPQSLAPHNA